MEKDNYHRIFIDKNKNSSYYNSILDFRDFEPFSSTRKIKSFDVNSKWIRIYQYENNYFLYAPCDWMYDLKYVIDDNKIQIKSAEVSSFKIYSIKRKKDEVFIKYKIPNSKKKELITVKPVDKSLGIFKFISVNDGVTNEYFMVNAENYKSFNIIVNECIEKTKEFDFSKP